MGSRDGASESFGIDFDHSAYGAPSDSINICRDVSESLPFKDYEVRKYKLFESNPEKCWLDIYTPDPTISAVQGRSQERSAENICYLGECNVPFLRVRTVQEFEEAKLKSKDSERASFYIYRQRHSWSRMYTSQQLFEASFGKPAQLNRSLFSVLCFGVKQEDNDMGGPQLWYRPRSCLQPNTSHLSAGVKEYDCGYTLKYMELNRREDPIRKWSERQSSITYSHTNEWFLISPSALMQLRLDNLMRTRTVCYPDESFTIHLLFIGAAMVNWKTYLAYLTHSTNAQVDRIIATELEDEVFNLLTVEDRQRFRLIEDRITDMFAMLDSTTDIISSLQEKYHIFHLGLEKVSIDAMRSDANAYIFHEKIREIQLIRKQLEALYERVKSSVQLLSSLLDLENGRSLRNLAEESRKESVAMRKLSEKATVDAAAVKVITIITLIYLPTTVATNFFSTTFVTSQPNGRGSNVAVADNWWVLVVVSIPLTAITFAAWWILQHKMLILEAAKNTATASAERMRRLRKTPVNRSRRASEEMQTFSA